jgi:hypothetical protein
LDSIATRVQARQRRARQRAEAVRQTLASGGPLASQLLIQAGLFDRRALRASARRAAALADVDEGAESLIADESGGRLVPGAELLAVIDVTTGS